MNRFRFEVPGVAVPQERPRVMAGYSFTPPETVAYQKLIRACAIAAGVQLLDGPVVMRCDFYFPDQRPKDFDNCVKTHMDALQGGRTSKQGKPGRAPVAFLNDSQVRHAYVHMHYGSTNPRVEVWLEGVPAGVQPQHGPTSVKAAQQALEAVKEKKRQRARAKRQAAPEAVPARLKRLARSASYGRAP